MRPIEFISDKLNLNSSPFHLFFQLPPCSKSFQEAQTDLNHTAAELNHSAGDVVQSSRGSSGQLAMASGKFSQDFDEFLDAGIEMAGHTQVQFQCLLRVHDVLRPKRNLNGPKFHLHNCILSKYVLCQCEFITSDFLLSVKREKKNIHYH